MSKQIALTLVMPGKLISPGSIDRRCTDVGWMSCFAILCTLFSGLVLYRAIHHREGRFFLFSDYEGEICGQGRNQFEPYIYVCENSTSLGDIRTRSVCLQQCPQGGPISQCMERNHSLHWNYSRQADDGYFEIVGFMCWASDPKAIVFFRTALRQSGMILLDMWYVVHFAWQPFVFCGVSGIVLAHLVIRMLRAHASVLSWVGIYILVMLPWGCALYLWFIEGSRFTWEVMLLIVLGLYFIYMALSHHDYVDKAMICLRMSCLCVVEMPGLEVGSLLITCVRFAILYFFVAALKYVPPAIQYNIRDLRVVFAQREDEAVSLPLEILYAVFFFYVHNVVTALWEYAIVHTTAVWYIEKSKTGKARAFAEPWGAFARCLRYHTGSMALAGMVICFVRPVRFLLGTLTAWTRMESNPLGTICERCFSCVVNLYETLEPFSANCYVDMALCSSSLCKAVRNTSDVMATDKVTASSLNGVTAAFHVIALALIWWVGFAITYVMVTTIKAFSNEQSPMYIPYKITWSVTGGVVSLICAFPFMMLFDCASDTILCLGLVEGLRAAAERDRRNEDRGRFYGGRVGEEAYSYLDYFMNSVAVATGCGIDNHL